jgi:hypothetical protein
MTHISKTIIPSGTAKRPIVFFGSEEFSLYSLQALIEAGFDIAAVVTKPDTKRGRGHKITEPAVKQYARQQGIAVWQPSSLNELLPFIRPLQPAVGESFPSHCCKHSIPALSMSTLLCCRTTAGRRLSNRLLPIVTTRLASLSCNS